MNHYRLILPPSRLKEMQRSFTSSVFLFPSYNVWNDSEVRDTDFFLAFRKNGFSFLSNFISTAFLKKSLSISSVGLDQEDANRFLRLKNVLLFQLIGQTASKNYTLKNVKEFFQDINYTDGWSQYQQTGYLLGKLESPKVEASFCIFD